MKFEETKEYRKRIIELRDSGINAVFHNTFGLPQWWIAEVQAFDIWVRTEKAKAKVIEEARGYAQCQVKFKTELEDWCASRDYFPFPLEKWIQRFYAESRKDQLRDLYCGWAGGYASLERFFDAVDTLYTKGSV